MHTLTLMSEHNLSEAFQTEVRAFVGLLEQAAQMAYGAVEAIVGKDASAVRRSMDGLRRHNVDVVAARDLLNKKFPGFEPAASDAQVMAYALEIFRSAEAVVHEWISGNGRAIAQGEAISPLEYWHRTIDLLLPELWDFGADLFVVKGAYDATLVEALKARNQKRVLFVGADTPVADAASETMACAFADSQQALRVFVDALERPLPFRFAYLTLASEAQSPAGLDDFKPVLEKSVMSRWMDVNTRTSYSRPWIDQAFRNLPLIAKGKNLSELNGRFAGRPAILVAPGPSLEKNIQALRQIQGRAVVIAQLQAVRRLYKEGIRPDFVVVLDPQDLTAPPFNTLDGVPDDFLTHLVVAVTCHPAVIRRFRSVYYFDGGSGVDAWLQPHLSRKLVDLSGSTTAIACLRLALHWRCAPVVVMGQDLALADGKRYAGDTAGTLSMIGTHELPGFYGGVVRSPSNYYLFHFALENLAKKAREADPGVELINCTEGGAFIDGFSHEALQDVIDQRIARRNHVDDWAIPLGIKDHDAAAREGSLLRGQVQSMLDALDATLTKLEVCNRLLKTAGHRPDVLSRLNAEEASMKVQLKKISIFSIVFEKEILDVVQLSKSAQTLNDGLNASAALYRLIGQGCHELRPSLVTARDELDALDNCAALA